jgi:hypothetical protein
MNITPYFNNLEYINATAEQVIKDFDLYGLEIKFSGNEQNAYNELLYQISPHIAQLKENNYKKLLDLLYRIDVNESKVAAIVDDASVGSLAEAISDLVIKRELQKIVIRKHFRPDNYDLD